MVNTKIKMSFTQYDSIELVLLYYLNELFKFV